MTDRGHVPAGFKTISTEPWVKRSQTSSHDSLLPSMFLGPWLWAQNYKEYIVTIMNHLSILTWAVLMTRPTGVYIEFIFFNHWM